ncbi:MAG: hypothetical protein WC858_02370 [Parcubacteria group bacterium]|jgi:hypothetical protein
MSSLLDLAAAIPVKAVLFMTFTSILFLLYVLKDLFFLVMRRDFGQVIVYLMYFTRNDNKKRTRKRRSDALHFREISSFSLRKIYNKNRALFLWTILRSLKATLANPIINLGRYSKTALAHIRGHIVERYSIGEIRRAAGKKFEEVEFLIFMIYDLSENKRRKIIKTILIRKKDLESIASNSEILPKTGSSLGLLKAAAKRFKENPDAFLPVKISIAL